MIDVLFVDNHLLVVSKPHGMLSQADVTGDDDVLTAGKRYIKDRFDKPGKVFLGLVHRLDRPAAGVMVFARTSKAASRLGDQFRARTVSKRYLAIVEGKAAVSGEMVDFLKKFGPGDVRVVPPVTDGGQRAVMRVDVLATSRRGGAEVSLLEVQLETGRAHQIRVQLAHRGYPILGDLRYGAQREFDGQNLALHSWSLEVEHPTLRKPMTWMAPPRSDWNDGFEDVLLRLHDARSDHRE
jgi:23S rRNA pseudouridine1911/1915/1917 synthase